jgi:multidrug resistance efflux pump
MSFVDTSELKVGALFQQKALQNVKIGDIAMINFPALPGRVFEAKVAMIPSAIGDAQLLASGQLPTTQQQYMSRLYPIHVELPDDFPADLAKVGLAAKVYIHTEGAGVVKPVALASQWIATSLDAIL